MLRLLPRDVRVEAAMLEDAFLDVNPGLTRDGRCGPDFLHTHADADGLRAAGLAPLVAGAGDSEGARRAVVEANRILGWSE